MNKKNPFRAYRAEQLGDAVWRFYVKEPFDKLLSEKPLIFEGGRGSGKTMFFLCNSWKERFKEIESMGENYKVLFDLENFIGLYHRADSTFITSFYGKGILNEKWESIFSTYFNIVISKEILLFLKDCSNLELIQEIYLEPLFELIKKKLRINNNCSNIKACIELFDDILDKIEFFTNDTRQELPTLLLPGRLINEIIGILHSIDCFKTTNFHVFIDEYETLNEYQQVQINTLIKMSKSRFVYDIGVKSKGIKSFQTLSGEVIQDPHDFTYFKPEAHLNEDDYNTLLVKICEKRLKEFAIQNPIEKEHHDIRFYLNRYELMKEIETLESSIRSRSFKIRLKELINSKVSATEDQIKFYKELGECELINSRIHLCLLLREGANAVTVEELYNEYTLWKQKKSNRYQDWMDNMRFATIFLLCREAKIHKQYYGFNVFTMLSSGIIRYFLELCEHSFDFAFANDFSFDKPRSLTIEEQTKAARYVSRYKISDIEGFKPHGKLLKRFIIILGQIFYELHTNPNSTLGEPEQNHFYTKTSELDEEVSSLLDAALMHNVLQERLPTKEKESEMPIETVDYHLNHIYCPYLEISYRKKRKIYISPEEIHILFLGKTANAKKSARRILSKYKATLENSQTSLAREQITLFERE